MKKSQLKHNILRRRLRDELALVFYKVNNLLPHTLNVALTGGKN